MRSSVQAPPWQAQHATAFKQGWQLQDEAAPSIPSAFLVGDDVMNVNAQAASR
jgi:hypothetical protein